MTDGELTAYRPMVGAEGQQDPYWPFERTAVPDELETVGYDPNATDEEKAEAVYGPGIRVNGDDDDEDGVADYTDTDGVVGENDLIEVVVHRKVAGVPYVLERAANSPLKVYTDAHKTNELFGDPANTRTAPLIRRTRSSTRSSSMKSIWMKLQIWYSTSTSMITRGVQDHILQDLKQMLIR